MEFVTLDDPNWHPSVDEFKAQGYRNAMKALLGLFNLLRNPHVIIVRHIHHKPPRDRNMGGEATAFCAKRIFFNLHQNFLPDFQGRATFAVAATRFLRRFFLFHLSV